MKHSYRKLLQQTRNRPEFWTERLVSEYVHELARTMQDNNINRSQLAKRACVPRSYITRILGGNANVTTNTMAKLAHALDSKVCVHIAPKAAKVHFFEAHDGGIWVAEPESSAYGQPIEKSVDAKTEKVDVPAWG